MQRERREMENRDETMGQWDTIRGDEGASWQAAPDATFGDLPTLRGEGGVVLAGRYKVLKRLGEGGMGSVWLAEDAKLDGRKVAVKMLPAILAGKKGAYRQVKEEALMAMKLSHSNIATVRAFEEDEGGNPFLVMDYVEGEGLDDILSERGPLGEEETVRLLGPVAAALDYAHSQGVVHRDVKPGNVMVRKDGTPFVLDFGIAREVQETMTMVTGKMSSGTLLYMSPEQLRGKGPTAAQDVYSFAAMAYECLAGHPPFFRGAIEDQIKNESPEELPESVVEGLRRGVMAGLAKEATERPGSCAGVLDGTTGARFQASAAGKKRVGRGEKAGWRWNVRGKTLMGWGTVLAVGLAVAAGVWMKRGGKKADEMQDTTVPKDRSGLSEEERKAQKATKKALGVGKREGETKTITLPGGAEMEMVWCPPGTFQMGSVRGDSEEKPRHQVTLTEGFWMAKYEVTQKQWVSVIGGDGNPSSHLGDDLPVEQVNWKDCQEFCKKTGLSLPTEAEWEYACRAGSTGAYGGTGKLDDMGWFDDNSANETHPVGKKQPNAWGLYDMHGNVMEWCQDWYHNYSDKAVTNPAGSGNYRLLRGGSFKDHASHCRSAYRGMEYWTDTRGVDYGFRPIARQD